jgi:hypothetical protein
MQRYTIFFITVDALHVSGSSSPTTLAVAAASLARTRYCVYSSWAPDDGRRNRPKHVEHRQ